MSTAPEPEEQFTPPITGSRKRLENVARNAVGPEPRYTIGYMDPMRPRYTILGQGTSYIAAMKLSAAKAPAAGLDAGTEGIVSYDLCETADANIGQINMMTASSFCGLGGALWGYHLARGVPYDHLTEIIPDANRNPEHFIPTATAAPLLNASERLFGHANDNRRHPPLPGSHVVCANKHITVRGPAYAWAIIAAAIAKDPETDSSLFIEDCGKFDAHAYGDRAGTIAPSPAAVEEMLEEHRNAVITSIAACGENYGGHTDGNSRYSGAFISARAIYAAADEVACALACAPYILLAQDDIPFNSDGTKEDPKLLLDLDIEEWEQRVWPGQGDFRTSFPPDKWVLVEGVP
ncbi:histidine decarboxylase, pyruvoyl type [Streptomyces sp. NPDC126510]|uniref:histidine decarboxylase, pyruvoyl type n=1 Tax=Streptomyces sp. NPDC126510 TaxID=3155317 RepID=UPI0033294264